MDVFTLKLVVLGTLFSLTFVFSLLPLLLIAQLRHTIDPNKRIQTEQVISLLSCFAGGVFMATAMLDLFPEVVDILENVLPDNSFPLPEFVVMFGFLLVLCVEQIVLACKETVVDTLSPIDRLAAGNLPFVQEPLQIQADESPPPPSTTAGLLPDTVELHAQSSFRSMLLLAAISLHSLFEGLAIGLQPDADTVWKIFVAVVLHKVIISSSVGLNLVQSELSLAAVVRLDLLFAVTSPLGLSLAMALEEFSHAAHMHVITGVLQGIACGTFLYVTFFEVLPRELSLGRDRLLKLLSVIFGFSVVCSVLFADPSNNAR